MKIKIKFIISDLDIRTPPEVGIIAGVLVAGVLVLVWSTHYCLSAMHPAQAREQL